MNRLVRAALGVALLSLLALGLLLLMLPRWLASDAVRAQIAARGEAVFGRDLRYARIELAWSPFALVMIDPEIAGAAPGAPPLARAPRAAFFASPRAWLSRSPAIEQVIVEDATLRLVAPEGSPAAVWELRALAASLRREAPESPFRVEASFELASGGRVVAEGSATPTGEIDLVLTLESVELASLAPPLEGRAKIAGAASGPLAVAGPLRRPDRVTAQLALAGGDVQLDEFALRGPLRVGLALAGGPGAWTGNFTLDATDAEIAVARSYRKPPGTRATIDGRVVRGKGRGLAFDDVKLRIGEPAASRSG